MNHSIAQKGRAFAGLQLFEGKITTAREVRAVIAELNIPDGEFKSFFASMTETDGDKARYLIAGIERQTLLRSGEVLADELIPGNVTLEHIFPKSPDMYWASEMNDDPLLARDMTNRLGNLCPLPGINQKNLEINRGQPKRTFSPNQDCKLQTSSLNTKNGEEPKLKRASHIWLN